MILICVYIVNLYLLFAISSYYHNLEFLCSVVLVFPLFILYWNNVENRYGFLEAYTNIMMIISALSLFFFVFSSLLGMIKPTGYYPHTQIGWGTNNYYDYFHLYCEGQEIFSMGYIGIRNIAIFLEGPMLAYTLSVALYYELFFRKEGFRKKVVVTMIITIITSFSTTGYIVVIILLYIKFHDAIRKYKYSRLLLLPVLLIGAVYGANYVIADKIASNIASTSIRIDDILTCLKCFAGNIVNGVGYQNIEALGEFRTVLRAHAGLSTGLGAILAFGGLLWGVWYLLPFGVAVKRYVTNPESRRYMGFILMAIFLLVVTVVHSRVLSTVVNAMCWLFIIKNDRDYTGG